MPEQPSTTAATPQPRPVRTTTAAVAAGLVAGYGAVLMAVDDLMLSAAEGLLMFLVGLGAATIANSTGVGGGVVFLPAFEFLSSGGHVAILASQIVGMSFVIQSFGMTVGSLRWGNHIFHGDHAETGVPVRDFLRMLGLVTCLSVPALLITQSFHASPPEAVLYAFKTVSIGLGLTVLVTTLMAHGKLRDRNRPETIDYLAIGLLSLSGGVATAFFSVGTGELVALYLFVRQFPLVTTAAIAVMASAVNVIAGVWDHLIIGGLPWDVLVFVIPGAMTGGYLARQFALMLGPVRLKVFAASWITASSAYLLWAV